MEQENSKARPPTPERTAGKTQSQHLNRDAETEKTMTEENKNAEADHAASRADQTHKLSEDARGLGPLQAGRIRLGAVDMIVGEGGVEVPGFVATRNEMFQLARYWATEIIKLDFDYFIYRSLGSSEWRTREFAARRLDTVSQFIGEGGARKALKEAEQAFKERVDPLSWKNFTGAGNSPGAAYSRESLQRAYELLLLLRGLYSHRGLNVQSACQVAQDYAGHSVAASHRFAELSSDFARLAPGSQRLHSSGPRLH